MDSLSTAGPGAFGAVLTGLPLEATPLYVPRNYNSVTG
jgi:hypothetical protein